MATRQDIEGLIQRVQDRFRGNDSGNSPILVMLGGFKFSLNTAAFQEMNHTSAYRWASQERAGKRDALQFTGFDDETFVLPGVIYPQFRGGLGQISQLRIIAQQGKPVKLIWPDGTIAGEWVIVQVQDTVSGFTPQGGARKQEFSVTIKRYEP